MENWKLDLISAARAAKITFESVELVGDEAHARSVIAVLRAMPGDSSGLILAEPWTPHRAASQNAKPTDILILHPKLGCLLIEVKAWSVGAITRIEAGTVFRRVAGFEEAHSPWKQVQDACFQIQKATRGILQQRSIDAKEMPFFSCMVALPNISWSEWSQKGFDRDIARGELLLKEDLEDPTRLWNRMKNYAAAKAGSRLPCSKERLDHVREALGSSAVRHARNQTLPEQSNTNLGQTIDDMERKDKRHSKEQWDLIEARFDGRPQLVRGVAGSGKSFVLVENLANLLERRVGTQLPLHGAAPPKRFAVVCFNRTLAPFLRRNLEEAYRRRTYCDLPSGVSVSSINVFRYELSDRKGGPLAYQRYENEPNTPDKAARFAARYSDQLDRLAKANPVAYDGLLYDAIYVDEGQDLLDEDYLFLLRLLRTDPATGDKNLVIFYDDAQNIYGRPRPTWTSLGLQLTGRRSYVMKTCFRNSKPVIDYAFNLLLGVQAETRVATKTFADTAYLKENNLVEELDDRWDVKFADRVEGLPPTVHLFENREAEKHWVVQTVANLIVDEKVRPEDILILFHHFDEFRSLESQLRRACPEVKGFVKPFGSSTNQAKDEYIFKDGHLTLAKVEAAKGYDCAVVFIVGADLFPNDVTGRAAFYVAATRCKLRLFTTGLSLQDSLAQEAREVADLLKHPLSSLSLEGASIQGDSKKGRV